MLFEQVKEVIVENLSVDDSQVTMEAKLKEDLGADSLAAIELMISLEDAIGVKIPDEDAMKFITVSDVVKYIEAHQ